MDLILFPASGAGLLFPLRHCCVALCGPVWPCGVLLPSLCVMGIKSQQLFIRSGRSCLCICQERHSALGQRTAARVELGLPNQGCGSDFADPVLPGSRLGRLELLIKILGSPEGFLGNFVQLRGNKFQVCF